VYGGGRQRRAAARALQLSFSASTPLAQTTPDAATEGITVAFVALAPVESESDIQSNARTMAVAVKTLINDETALKSALAGGVVLLADAQNTTADAVGVAPGSAVSVVTLTRVRVVWTFSAWFSYVASVPVTTIAGATVGGLFALLLLVGVVMVGLRVRARSTQVTPSTAYTVDSKTGLVIAIESQTTTPHRSGASADARAADKLTSALKGGGATSARRAATVVPLESGNPTARSSAAASASTSRSDVPLVPTDDESTMDGSVVTASDAETSRAVRKKNRAPLPPLRPARARQLQLSGAADSSDAGGSDDTGYDSLTTEIAAAHADRAQQGAKHARSALGGGRAPLSGGAMAALKRASAGLRSAGANLVLMEDAGSPKLAQELPPKRGGLNLASLAIPPPEEGGVKSLLGAGPGKLSAVDRLKLRARATGSK
jgi:hypothetical protein